LTVNGGDSATAYFYGCSIEDLRLENFGVTGLQVLGNFFESSITRVQARSSASTTGYGIYAYNGSGSGIVSSINITNCIVSGGENGIYVKSPTGDVNVICSTALLAQEYGIFLENNFSSAVLNCHLENNWESAANLAAGQAGLYVSGHGSIIGCYGTTNSKQKYVVRAYAGANSIINIIGGISAGDTTHYAYIGSGAGGVVNLMGTQTYTSLDDPTGTIARIGALYKDVEPVSTSGTGEDTLMTFTLRDDHFGPQGMIHIRAAGTKTNTNGNKKLKLHFGSTTAEFHPDSSNDDPWRLDATIWNYRDDTNQTIEALGNDGSTTIFVQASATEDTTAGDIVVKITGECAHASDVITQSMIYIEAK
jgi:hypothetical protein